MQYMTNSQGSGVGYIGQLAQMPDGQVYQLSQAVDGLGNVSQTWLPVDGIGQTSYDQPQLGDVRRGPDGQLYQYSQTVDGLGNIGFAWASLIPLAAQALPAIANAVGNLFGGGKGSAAQTPAPAAAAPASATIDWRPIIPQIAQAVAGVLNRRRRSPGLNGFAEDGDLYRGVGMNADEPLGLAEDDPRLSNYYLGENGGLYQLVQGIDEDPDDLRGVDADPYDLRGLEEDPYDLRGVAADADDLGLAPEEALNGLDGYLRESPESQLRGYIPRPSPSPAFVPQTTPSPLWQSLW
jgi:hypothetical protein